MCSHLIEVYHSCWLLTPIWTYSQLCCICLFPDYKNISIYLQQSIHDLNKSWLLSFGSRAIRATGLWRPLNYSSQTDDWLLIHSFFWKECLIIIPISTRPTRSCEAKPSRFCTPASQAHQIKRVCQWHFEDGSPKTEEKKMNYVRSLWILHCRGWCPICPSFPVSDKTAIGMCSHWHNTAAVNSSPSFPFPRYHCEQCSAVSCGFSKRKALGDKGRRDDHTVIEWDVYLESGLG